MADGVAGVGAASGMRVRQILRAAVDHDIFTYSLTLKPEEDSPEKLAEYARTRAIRDKDWLFLTGKPDEVDMLRHLLGFADPRPDVDRDKARHSGMLRYGNEPLVFWGWVPGVAEPEKITECLLFAQASKPGEVRVAPNFTRSPSRPAPAQPDSEHKHH